MVNKIQITLDLVWYSVLKDHGLGQHYPKCVSYTCGSCSGGYYVPPSKLFKMETQLVGSTICWERTCSCQPFWRIALDWREQPCTRLGLFSAGRLYPRTGWGRDIKSWFQHLNLGLLWRVFVHSELLHVRSAKTFLRVTASQTTFCLILFHSLPQQVPLLNKLLGN